MSHEAGATNLIRILLLIGAVVEKGTFWLRRKPPVGGLSEADDVLNDRASSASETPPTPKRLWFSTEPECPLLFTFLHTVEFILCPDEGRGFNKTANRVTATVAMVDWLNRYLIPNAPKK